MPMDNRADCTAYWMQTPLDANGQRYRRRCHQNAGLQDRASGPVAWRRSGGEPRLIRDGKPAWQGRTPLHLAAERGYADAIKALVEADAEIRAAKPFILSGALWETQLVGIKDSVGTDSDSERFANLLSPPHLHCHLHLRISLAHIPI